MACFLIVFWYYIKNIFTRRISLETRQLKEIPKAELHCHLDGSLSLETIRQLAKLAHIKVPQDDSDLKPLVTAPASCESLIDYLKTFDFIRPLLQTSEALRLAAYDVVRQAALEHVIYIEIRFAPELSMDKGLSAGQVVEAVLDGMVRAQEDFDIVAKAIVCGLRQSPLAVSQGIFTNVLDFIPKGLVGFDFAGNEKDFPPAILEEVVTTTTAYGLPFTLHAGECGCPQNISDAMNLGAKRLGHMTAITNQSELLKEIVSQQITAELCLTSNLQTKAAKTIADFPYLQLKEAGARLSINTDNRTVSDTTLTKEYALFAQYFNTSIADFLAHNQDAIKGSFATATEKADLLDRLEKSYAAYVSK